MALLKTLLFTVVVPGSATILVPRWILAASADEDRPLPLGLRLTGLPLILLGAAIYLRCAWDFAVAGRGTPAPLDPPKELIARGLYRHVRNPMYLGVLSVLIGEAIFFSAAPLLVYAAAMAAGFHLFIVLYEEPALRRLFGDSYRCYLETVPRWFPRRAQEGGISPPFAARGVSPGEEPRAAGAGASEGTGERSSPRPGEP